MSLAEDNIHNCFSLWICHWSPKKKNSNVLVISIKLPFLIKKLVKLIISWYIFTHILVAMIVSALLLVVQQWAFFWTGTFGKHLRTYIPLKTLKASYIPCWAPVTIFSPCTSCKLNKQLLSFWVRLNINIIDDFRFILI